MTCHPKGYLFLSALWEKKVHSSAEKMNFCFTRRTVDIHSWLSVHTVWFLLLIQLRAKFDVSQKYNFKFKSLHLKSYIKY